MADSIEPPEPDEVEVSAFGPGYGECILVHLGQGEWMIVDSCMSSRRSSSIPVLQYLRAMKVDPADAVKLVVATHWHDDHIRGMSDVVTACRSAAFACSAALSGQELLAGIGSLPPSRGGKRTSGVKEMRLVLDLLASGQTTREAKWTVQDRRLFGRQGVVDCEVLALAPCDKVLRSAYTNVVRLVEQGESRRVPRPECNIGAVVLWVEVGDATVLLGSDLQENPGGGWSAVLSCREDYERRSEIFKVPHHGSNNAHHDPVWDRLLVDQPEAVLCPHRNGRTKLPTPDDLARLCQLANLHITAPHPADAVVRKGRPMRAVGDFGRVTLRRRVGASTDWRASYGGQAGPACLQLPYRETAGISVD